VIYSGPDALWFTRHSCDLAETEPGRVHQGIPEAA
jgi:hypothetical protein